jgi:hypothetical protein
MFLQIIQNILLFLSKLMNQHLKKIHEFENTIYALLGSTCETLLAFEPSHRTTRHHDSCVVRLCPSRAISLNTHVQQQLSCETLALKTHLTEQKYHRNIYETLPFEPSHHTHTHNCIRGSDLNRQCCPTR